MGFNLCPVPEDYAYMEGDIFVDHLGRSPWSAITPGKFLSWSRCAGHSRRRQSPYNPDRCGRRTDRNSLIVCYAYRTFKSSAFFGISPDSMVKIVQSIQPPLPEVNFVQRLVPLLLQNPHPLRLGGIALKQKPAGLGWGCCTARWSRGSSRAPTSPKTKNAGTLFLGCLHFNL